MAGQTKATKGRRREAGREVLAMSPGYGFPERAVEENVRRLVRPLSAPADDVRKACEFNLSKGYCRTRWNEDTEEAEFLITKRGLAKQEVR